MILLILLTKSSLTPDSSIGLWTSLSSIISSFSKNSLQPWFWVKSLGYFCRLITKSRILKIEMWILKTEVSILLLFFLCGTIQRFSQNLSSLVRFDHYMHYIEFDSSASANWKSSISSTEEFDPPAWSMVRRMRRLML